MLTFLPITWTARAHGLLDAATRDDVMCNHYGSGVKADACRTYNYSLAKRYQDTNFVWPKLSWLFSVKLFQQESGSEEPAHNLVPENNRPQIALSSSCDFVTKSNSQLLALVSFVFRDKILKHIHTH